MLLPNDPNMLFSFVNMKLRDTYTSLLDLCDDFNVPESVITDKLAGIGYHYDEENNQFIS